MKDLEKAVREWVRLREKANEARAREQEARLRVLVLGARRPGGRKVEK
jgi:hypothetical protein